MGRVVVRRALVSVSDKSGLDVLAKSLADGGVELVATGGTRRFIEALGIRVIEAGRINEQPEAFGGRLKTLGFRLFGAILFDRDVPEHLEEARKFGVPTIDLVVCNLYPFGRVAKGQDVDIAELVENIDIGGVSLIRAASKNYRHVAVLSDPDDYGNFLDEFRSRGGPSLAVREAWAVKGFVHTYHYDQTIALALSRRLDAGGHFSLFSKEVGTALRYGENPHQKARIVSLGDGLAGAGRLQGREMSYNNYLDADAALGVVADLCRQEVFGTRHCVSVVKHGNPCGLAVHSDQHGALELAWEGDSVSSFGGILCFNRRLEAKAAGWIFEKFVEVVAAPSFCPEALEVLGAKKNLRLLEIDPCAAARGEVRSIGGGWLVQDGDDIEGSGSFKSVTEKQFGREDFDGILFGVIACGRLKSNAVCLVVHSEGAFRIIGAAMGNPNRIVSVEQAVAQARAAGNTDLGDAIAVSDAFFPFKDGVELLHRHGIEKVVQPGGSMRDGEVIEACNRLGMAMVFTGRRHFRH